MADYDAKQFLDLLQEYKSDETKKARRNLSTIAFVVIATRVIGLKLTELRVFGADLSRIEGFWLLTVAISLLIYWLVMFFLAWWRDQWIQAERAELLKAQLEPMEIRLKEFDERMQRGDRLHMTERQERKVVTAGLKAYQAQQERTYRAARVGSMIRHLELYVPLTLCAAALIYLGIDILEALTVK